MAIFKSAHIKSNICAANNIKGAFNRMKVAEKLHVSSGGTGATCNAAIIKRFTHGLVEELKDLEPDGHANPGRINYLSTKDVIQSHNNCPSWLCATPQQLPPWLCALHTPRRGARASSFGRGHDENIDVSKREKDNGN